MPCLVVWRPTPSFSTLLKLNLFGWVVVDDWRMLTDAWSLKPFLTLSSVIMSVNLGSSLTKNLTFQHTLINLPVIIIIITSTIYNWRRNTAMPLQGCLTVN